MYIPADAAVLAVAARCRGSALLRKGIVRNCPSCASHSCTCWSDLAAVAAVALQRLAAAGDTRIKYCGAVSEQEFKISDICNA
jgi:hypothetical protein